jgi:membrane-associated phospholipid phosphatase
MTFRLLTTYIGCYLVYLTMPVLGPRESAVVALGVPDGFFAAISEAIRARGDSLGTAFPSSHAAGAVTVAVIAIVWLRPWIAALLSAQAIAVVMATVYTGNHYGIDAAAGTGLALALQVAVVPRLARILVPQPVRPVPLLPRFSTFLQPQGIGGVR